MTLVDLVTTLVRTKVRVHVTLGLTWRADPMQTPMSTRSGGRWGLLYTCGVVKLRNFGWGRSTRASTNVPRHGDRWSRWCPHVSAAKLRKEGERGGGTR